MSALATLPVRQRPASELEGLVLGALLDSKEPQALLDASGLSAESCSDPRAKICVGLIVRLAARKRHCDASSIFAAGKSANVLEEGALGWLQGLQAANDLEGERFVQVASELKKISHGKLVSTQLRQQALAIESQGLNPSRLAGFLSDLGLQVSSQYAPDDDASADILELAHEWDNPSGRGHKLIVPSGVAKLDEVIGGFVPSFNMLLADPQVGKSKLMASIIDTLIRRGVNVGFAGLEEGHRFLTRRLIARRLGLKISEVGTIKLNEEQQTAYDAFNAEYYEHFKKLKVYPFSGVGIDQLILRITKWVNDGAQIIFIDHMGEIRHRSANGEGGNWAIAESYRRLRDLARRLQVPIVGLAHRSTSVRDRPGPPQPPRPSDVGLTGEAEKMVRLMLGLWIVNGQLRATVIKNNEGPSHINSPNTSTVQFESVANAGLIDPDGGFVVNLSEERRHAREERELKIREESDRKATHARERAEKFRAEKEKKKKDAKEKEAAEEAAKKAKEPQASLFGANP